MTQPASYNSFNEGTASRRFTGFPLNSTLVSSYTPDTIRSIISQAASGQPYSTAVWIRLNRSGIQVSAQDPQIARTRIPVFIPIGLTHDIFMLPTINNVICIVYDEIQSNMKGVLLYVVHPSDAQAIREEFRMVKQASGTQQQSPVDSRYSNTNEIVRLENNQLLSPLSSRSPLFNRQSIRQPSPRRLVYVRDYDGKSKRDLLPPLPQLVYDSSKGSYSDHRRHRRNRSGQSPSKRSIDSVSKKDRTNTSRSPDKRARAKLEVSRSSPELAREQDQQEQQRKQQELLAQQQIFLQQQQQRMANWQPGQQPPLIPVGIYNRYVPKTIPLPTGETLKTTLPPPGAAGAEMNGTALAYVEPVLPNNVQNSLNARSRSRSISPPSQQQDRRPVGSSTPYQSRRQHSSQPSRTRQQQSPAVNNHIDHADDETKQYIKKLMDEMQAMKIEMNKLRQAAAVAPKGRSDSIQVDLKEIRSHIDLIRSRMAMTPRIIEK